MQERKPVMTFMVNLYDMAITTKEQVLKCGHNPDEDWMLIITGEEHSNHSVWRLNREGAVSLIGTLRADKFKNVMRLRRKTHIKLNVGEDEFEWAENDWHGKRLEAICVSVDDLPVKTGHVTKPVKKMKDRHYGVVEEKKEKRAPVTPSGTRKSSEIRTARRTKSPGSRHRI